MKDIVCRNCGFVGKPKKYAKGNMLMEIILWLMLLIPGIIYSIWRLTTYEKVCPKCKSKEIVPVDSPIGQKLLKENN